jgi:peptidyl-prolyl cis-trans isomerase D
VDGLQRKPNPALGSALQQREIPARPVPTDAIKNKRNTEAVEVAPAVLIAGRVVEFKPAAKRPLAEVDRCDPPARDPGRSTTPGRQAGEAKLAAAKASGDAAGFGPVKTIAAPSSLRSSRRLAAVQGRCDQAAGLCWREPAG